MSFEPDKVRLMKQSVSLEQLNMDIYLLYQKTSPKKQTIIFGLLEIQGALSPLHIMKKMLMLNIAKGWIHVTLIGELFCSKGARLNELVEKNRNHPLWSRKLSTMAGEYGKMFQRNQNWKSKLSLYIPWPDRYGIPRWPYR